MATNAAAKFASIHQHRRQPCYDCLLQYTGCTTLKDGAVLRQRPVCVYPKQARYNGPGDINVAANFTCSDPGAEQPGASTADLNQIRNSLRQRALLGPVR